MYASMYTYLQICIHTYAYTVDDAVHKVVRLDMAVGARFDRIDHPVVHSNLAAMSAQVLLVIANRTEP